MKNQKGFTSIELMILVIFLAVSISWVVNLFKFIDCDFEPSYKAEIIHGIGVVTLLSIITAWIDVGK